MAAQDPYATTTALVLYSPSPSSLFALIRQRAREAAVELRKIAPDISPERAATFIFYSLLALAGTAAVVLGVFGGGAALVGALSSVSYTEMAVWVATNVLGRPALQSLVLKIICDSVGLFVGEAVASFAVGGMAIKGLMVENNKLINDKNAEMKTLEDAAKVEKKTLEDAVKAKADEIEVLEKDKKAKEVENESLKKDNKDMEDRIDYLQLKLTSLDDWVANVSARLNVPPPDIIY
ncbi:hypothetical protein BG015_001743 [Linnemannia schmuckeri]|uniref:Uncharacterized protein n=1 Tax=Linnemannia schmuckeri TaxID=64567 RepID=A0A9P5RPE2_9FUNG|nr:hypothetical protein BG015_001743 [Linnemannia schmuckeri]